MRAFVPVLVLCELLRPLGELLLQLTLISEDKENEGSVICVYDTVADHILGL